MSQPIPREIAPTETLIRGIVHPYFYSNSQKRLKAEAFLPPAFKRDVSVLRLSYTDEHFCKRHCKGLRIGTDGRYVGMAAVAAKSIEEANDLPTLDGIIAVEATPLDGNYQTISIFEVTTDTAGLPMHADILYRDPAPRGKPNPTALIAARYLLSKASYYSDPQPESDNWDGDNLQPVVSG